MKPILKIGLVFSFIPVFLQAQIQIKGRILDQANRQPIPYATVYLNGTTRGTITAPNGEFTIENPILPSLLVVSHISYFNLTFPLDSTHQILPDLYLKERDLNLTEIKVTDHNMRAINLEIFSNWLLGTNKTGKSARILNDSVLFFYPEYYSSKTQDTELKTDRQTSTGLHNPTKKPRLKTHQDSVAYYSGILKSLEVIARSPIHIDMPLLGQKLQYDMVDFKLTAKSKIQKDCQMLGYFYFEPYSIHSDFDQAACTRNQKTTYYHSIQHFCRSLYHNSLLQNGYKLYVHDKKMQTYLELENDSLVSILPGGERAIIGKKDQFFLIEYYSDFHRLPVDLNIVEHAFRFQESGMRVLSDTCMIQSDGSIPNNQVLSFSGELSTKRLGSFLPFDYQPPKHKK